MNSLPVEMIKHILDFLDYSDLCTTRITCKLLRIHTDDEIDKKIKEYQRVKRNKLFQLDVLNRLNYVSDKQYSMDNSLEELECEYKRLIMPIEKQNKLFQLNRLYI